MLAGIIIAYAHCYVYIHNNIIMCWLNMWIYYHYSIWGTWEDRTMSRMSASCSGIQHKGLRSLGVKCCVVFKHIACHPLCTVYTIQKYKKYNVVKTDMYTRKYEGRLLLHNGWSDISGGSLTVWRYVVTSSLMMDVIFSLITYDLR